jgi:hypothetical protein
VARGWWVRRFGARAFDVNGVGEAEHECGEKSRTQQHEYEALLEIESTYGKAVTDPRHERTERNRECEKQPSRRWRCASERAAKFPRICACGVHGLSGGVRADGVGSVVWRESDSK